MLRLELWRLGPLALVVMPLAAAQDRSVCDAGTPHLEHSAPWVGGNLDLTLDGATPGASVRLFHSPSAGHTPTPFGLLELERGLLGLVAGGQADAQGHWSARLAIPLDGSLVEVEGHYQALVQDPAGPATLSAAVHLRYLGPRSYTLCAGEVTSPDTHPSLDVHAIADGNRVASIALGPWRPANCPNQSLWRPVFSANLARGAFLSGCGELVVFDNFACAVDAVLGVESAFQRLLPSADGRLAYVLEQPDSGAAARIRALDLESATFVATLELPDTCAAHWSMDESSSLAYVQDADPVTGELMARRVDLAGWRVLDALRLGTAPDADLKWLEVGHGWLYAGAKNGPFSQYIFTAIDLDPPGTSVSVVPFGIFIPKPPVAVPFVERLFVAAANAMGPVPDSVHVAPLEQPQRLAWDYSAPSGSFTFGAAVVRDDHLWVLGKSYDSDYPARLWNVDALALTWRVTADNWAYPWPVSLFAARGPLVDVLLMPRPGLRTSWAHFEPELIVLDPSSGAVRGSWPLAWGAVAGYVLEPE